MSKLSSPWATQFTVVVMHTKNIIKSGPLNHRTTQPQVSHQLVISAGRRKPNNLSPSKFGATQLSGQPNCLEVSVIGAGARCRPGHCCRRCNQMSTGIKLKYRKNINQKMAQSATRMTPQIWGLGASNSCLLMGWTPPTCEFISLIRPVHRPCSTRISHFPWPWLRESVARLCSLDMRDEWITFPPEPLDGGTGLEKLE